MPMEPLFTEKIKSFKIACEMLETLYNAQPACIFSDFKTSDLSKASGVGQLLENGARKRRKKKGVAE
ncbi:g8580 [Coccomyxa elongata]